MVRVIYTEFALDDLRKIRAYIAQDNPEAGRRLLKRIDQRCRLLADTPLSGTSVSEFMDKPLTHAFDWSDAGYSAPFHRRLSLARHGTQRDRF